MTLYTEARGFDGRLAAPMCTHDSEDDMSRLTAPIVPPVARPVLDGRIARFQLDLNAVVQLENDPARHDVQDVYGVSCVHSWIVRLHDGKQSRQLRIHLGHCRLLILYLWLVLCVRWQDRMDESEAADRRKVGRTFRRQAVVRVRRRSISSPHSVNLQARKKFHSDSFDLRVTDNDGLAVWGMSCYQASNVQNVTSSPGTTKVSSVLV